MAKQRKKSNADRQTVDKEAESLARENAEDYGAILEHCYRVAREVASTHREPFTYRYIRDVIEGQIGVLCLPRSEPRSELINSERLSTLLDAACALALDDLGDECVISCDETYSVNEYNE